MNKEALLKTFDEHNLDAIVSNSQQFRIWFTGLKATAGFLFVERDQAELIIDSRYIEKAREVVKNATVTLQYGQSLFERASSKNYARIGIEEEYVTLKDLALFQKLFPKSEFVQISGQNLRIIKSEEEITYLKKAGQIALSALKDLEPYIKPGISELDLYNQLEFLVKKHGATKGSFDFIVLSGVNGSLPHGVPSTNLLKEGDLLTIDFGALYKGYCSDITRFFHVGKVTNPQFIEIGEIVTEALRRGIEAIKPGATTSDIDEACRGYIIEKGYGDKFVHGTGHGLGIDIHELPFLSNTKLRTDMKPVYLRPGMVVTVEPGIYLPGVTGVRIEEDVLVTENGFEILSKL